MKPLLQSLILVWVVIIAVAGAPRAAADQAAADEVVARLETTLIENMKAGDSMSFDERFETLRPLLGEIMAVERMGRFLFGRDWASFEPGQRERFAQAFLDLSAATYAGQFKEFGGERFDPAEVVEQAEDRVVVKRRLTTGSGRKIAFDYLMTRTDSGWKIVTIITDGVSDLAVKRSQYRRLLDSDGFDAVIEHIQDAVESQRSD
ncbi:MAG: ABC transporter substrate-binding protein [Wenzhouxiangellaceae bacterium]